MKHELSLTRSNRLMLAHAFASIPRVDYSIDCLLEDQMGRAYVDDLQTPTAFAITTGPFWYFAGNAASPQAAALESLYPAWTLLMPSGPGWLERIRQTHPTLKSITRTRFSAESLSAEHLSRLLTQSTWHDKVTALTLEQAERLQAIPESYLDLSEYESTADFIQRGMGFTVEEDGIFLGAAFASLVCSRGIEVSIYIDEPYRQKGLATALSCRLLLACLNQGGRPNWDAANEESCSLAKKLGYTFAGTYEAHYYPEEK